MFTTSYPLPTDCHHTVHVDSYDAMHDSYASIINIGTEIWTITDNADKENYIMNIRVFNTNTTQYRKIEFDTPENFGNLLISTMNVDDHIYMWRAYKDEEESMLFKMDTNTAIISHVVSIRTEANFIKKNCAVIGNLMYALELNETETDEFINLHTINLETKVQSSQFLKYVVENTRFQLIANDDDLYLYECLSDKDRIMYKIDNGQLTVVSKDQLNAGQDDFVQYGDFDKNGILYKDVSGLVVIYRDTFDFKAYKWTRALSMAPWVHPYQCDNRGSCEINGNIYMLIDLPTIELKYDIRVFEKVPRLESSCLMPVVEEYMKNEDGDMVEKVKNLIPITMRIQLDNMISWRVVEKKEMADEVMDQEMEEEDSEDEYDDEEGEGEDDEEMDIED